jgi:hypothetical protein
VSRMCVNVSNVRRTPDPPSIFPGIPDMAGHGSGGRSSRPVNCERAALRFATGPGLGNNSGGTIATDPVPWPRDIPGAAPELEEPAAANPSQERCRARPQAGRQIGFSPHPITFVIWVPVTCRATLGIWPSRRWWFRAIGRK